MIEYLVARVVLAVKRSVALHNGDFNKLGEYWDFPPGEAEPRFPENPETCELHSRCLRIMLVASGMAAVEEGDSSVTRFRWLR